MSKNIAIRTVRETETEAHRAEDGVTLSWRYLSVYALKSGRPPICKQIINNVCGTSKPGDLTAILGASGAGKSSLMTALAFRTEPGFLVDGDIRANGIPIDLSYMMRHSGYMHQEDMFVETMTVAEHLWFMARMKLGEKTKTSVIEEKVDRLLRDVGLTCRKETRIGAGADHADGKILSGGEKKRLAFAAELLTDPRILFLDEPTTGQDSHSATVLVSHLTSFAARGRTVLCTIHQPSSTIFDSFNRIILIANGRLAFTGTAERAVEFFASQGYQCPHNYNPADFLVATIADRMRSNQQEEADCEKISRKICDSFLVTEESKLIDLTLEAEIERAKYKQSKGDPRWFERSSALGESHFYWRLFWLTHRGFLQVLRDPSVQLCRLIQKLSVATIVGLCFLGAINLDQLGIQATQGVIFILVTENVFTPMYATLAIIPKELPVLRREYRAGMYPIHLYYVARLFSLVPGLLVEPLLFSGIIYWLTGLRNTAEAFGITLFLLILTLNVSTACGCFFSAVFETVPLAMAYLVPFDYLLMITMGPFVKLGSLPIYVRWVKYISWLLHSTEALTIVQWRGITNISCEAIDPDLPCITHGSEVLRRYDFEESNLSMDILLMLLIYIIFHALGCVCLWNRCRFN